MTEAEIREFEFFSGYHEGVGRFHDWTGRDFGEPAFMSFHKPGDSNQTVYGIGERKGWDDAVIDNVRLSKEPMHECADLLRDAPIRVRRSE